MRSREEHTKAEPRSSSIVDIELPKPNAHIAFGVVSGGRSGWRMFWVNGWVCEWIGWAPVAVNRRDRKSVRLRSPFPEAVWYSSTEIGIARRDRKTEAKTGRSRDRNMQTKKGRDWDCQTDTQRAWDERLIDRNWRRSDIKRDIATAIRFWVSIWELKFSQAVQNVLWMECS